MTVKNLIFKYTWRNYQEKFLDGFKHHIKDNHLHVVAPPGSGKTILGLEMLIRIGKPALVLSPTLTIRNQWKDRLEDFFLGHSGFKDYTSDLKKPKYITFSTYQSLFALFKSFDGDKAEKLVAFIKENNIETLVLDEAHHLKNEWWNCLYLLKSIQNLTLVSLTATPPYDSPAQELDRYFDLCGPIDDEIAVPDLIKNGDLCPHQDFIHFSVPDKERIQYIVTYREHIMAFVNDLKNNRAFQDILLDLDIYARTEASLEGVYANPSFFSAVLIFLNACGISIGKEKLHILGFTDSDTGFPSFTYEWSEILLQRILIDDRASFAMHEEVLMPLEKELRRIGVWARQKINFIGDDFLYKNLANSPSKLESIAIILQETFNDLGSSTRTVVLTDFIRKEFLNFDGADTKELNQLGVVSIFQYILAKTKLDAEVGVLTGSLVILHKTALPYLRSMLLMDSLIAAPLKYQKEFSSIRVKESSKNKIVSAITALFKKGIIKVLIGTKSLLGEGWDAPSINTLILASYVGSFVSSNQMRGRAIRTDADNPEKTGAIWHLACLDPTISTGGKDIEKLQQRFLAFTGVSLSNEAYIENGLERLNLPADWDHDEERLEFLNQKMIEVSKAKDKLKERWEKAILNGHILVKELKIPFRKDASFAATKKLVSFNAFKYLLFQVSVGLFFLVPEYLIKNYKLLLAYGWSYFLYFLVASLFIGLGPKTFKAIKLYFLFGDQYKKTLKIGSALLQYMRSDGTLTSSEVQLHSEQRPNGSFFIHLKGASQHESSLFINLLEEIIAPVENPRYLLVSGHWLKKRLGFRMYYTVPAIYAKRKNDALAFQKYWNSYVETSRLQYMYTIKGRKELLKARFAHITYEFEEPPSKALAWK